MKWVHSWLWHLPSQATTTHAKALSSREVVNEVLVFACLHGSMEWLKLEDFWKSFGVTLLFQQGHLMQVTQDFLSF